MAAIDLNVGSSIDRQWLSRPGRPSIHRFTARGADEAMNRPAVRSRQPIVRRADGLI
jgi:hypothetical protein